MWHNTFEVESDGDSVVIWEAGIGHRIVYPIPEMAEYVYDWMVQKSSEFYKAKQERGIAVICVFGDDQTPYSFVRQCLHRSYLAGLEVREKSLKRPNLDYW